MSVRLRKWKGKDGKVLEHWAIDVKVAMPGRRPQRVRDFSPVNTRRGALQYERQVRDAILAGTLGKEVKEVPTLESFQSRFLDYSEVNNKPSTVYAKRWRSLTASITSFSNAASSMSRRGSISSPHSNRSIRRCRAARTLCCHC